MCPRSVTAATERPLDGQGDGERDGPLVVAERSGQHALELGLGADFGARRIGEPRREGGTRPPPTGEATLATPEVFWMMPVSWERSVNSVELA